ncbi:helix-turn-helix domain-containing protein [Streptantibioticus ferralitis]|uniref:Helix-turn-helix transcriptional regulator n=1 Tax=Streptantibioticus ferralitis TaxID=236510 RepID=A0ABT5YZ94_9ACTN|nr:helix-turn-helix transcriptional regulator [Streptantibioticus ferralitis]MDF2256924.1 helix-turn-helix transcriptional regulator [Streptantibioticus ferralitis]
MRERQRFGQHLARLRRSTGKSQREFAELLCALSGVQTLTRNEVSRWERGERLPETWLPFIAQVAGMPLADLERAAAPARWPDNVRPVTPTVADFLPEGDLLAPLVAQTGQRIGAGTVQDLVARVHGLRLADDVLAGRDLLPPAVRELKSAIRLYRESTFPEDTGQALLRAIGELAQIAGWITSDAGEHRQAERIYRVGLSAAHSAGDATLAANLLSSLSYQVANTGDARQAVTMAQAAVEEAIGQAPPRARALYLDRLAWAYTKAQDAQDAMRALGEAEAALAEHSQEEEPAYLYWVDGIELQVMEARVYTELRRPLRAVPLLTDVLMRYDSTHAREITLYRSWLAVALVDANEPEQAASEAHHVVSTAVEVASARTAERSRVVLRRLQDFQDVPEVRTVLNDYRYLLIA